MARNMLKYFNSIYFLLILVFSGYGVSFFRSDNGILVYLALTITGFLINRIRITKYLRNVIIVWSIYAFAIMLVYNVFTPGFYLRHLLYFMSGYLLISIYRFEFFFKYERYIVILSIVSVFFYLWQSINLNSLASFISFFNVDSSSAGYNESSRSIFIYNINHNAIKGLDNRNCGFTWEPGPFSIFIVLAIYFNFLRTKMSMKRNKYLLVLIAALITTRSTTGILIFMILFLYMYVGYVRINANKLMIGLLSIVVIGYAFLELDFLFEKVLSLYSSGDADTIIRAAENRENYKSLGRFAVFEIGWKDFINYPIFGYGSATNNSYLSRIGVNVNMVSGLATSMGTYGIFGLASITYFSVKSSRILANVFDSGKYYGFFILFVMSFIAFHAQTFVILYAILMMYTVGWGESEFLKNKMYLAK